jgi:putative tryptophan/tyrosine transport system ATP-binding protein
MLRFQDVSFTIGTKTIIDSISFSIEKGDFIVVLGQNGAGKSTLFDLISGKKTPSSGSIMYHDTDITRSDDIARSTFIARLYQNPRHNVVASMTVEENLALSLYKNKTCSPVALGLSMLKDQFDSLLAALFQDPKAMRNTQMSDLSGGQQQSVAAITVTASVPEMLLLDEPTAALDPGSATKVLQFLHAQIKNHHITTLLITHDPYLALALGNKIWVIEAGCMKKQIDKTVTTNIHPEDLIGHIAYDAI